MWLSWLELVEWRCYRTLSWRPDPGVNVLVGPNGAGKTSVLEAVAYLSSLRSFRGTVDAGLIRSGGEWAVARGGFGTASGESRVEVEIPERGRRRVLVNGKRPTRLSDVGPRFPVVAFLPDDLDLVKGAATGRRAFLDGLGSLLSPGYGSRVAEFEQVLRQRNALLRQDGPGVDPASLEVWDERLVVAARALWSERVELVDGLVPALADAHGGVSGAGEALAVALEPGWGDPRTVVDASSFDPEAAGERLGAELRARRGRELEQRTTTVGPHRDELRLVVDGRPARAQASQGEQRSVVVAMRLASYRMLAERFGQPPVLLLDDVFSELDLLRTAAVVDLLPRGQVLVTTTRDDEVPGNARRWQVRDGEVDEG